MRPAFARNVMVTTRQRTAPARDTDRTGEEIIRYIRRTAHPLQSANDLDPLMERIGDARFVLLGEASHGTSEYYVWRTRISRRLIEEKGFSFIAVEGDWPDCYRVNRYVKGLPDAGRRAYDVLHEFHRWPTWMWANWEIVALGEWLKERNAGLPEERRVGFYGLDVYSLWESLEAVLDYLERTDPDAAFAARRAWRCFEPYGRDVQEYARATVLAPASCEREVVQMLQELRAAAPSYENDGRESYFNAEQNAIIAKNAETYYRTMVRGDASSWNVRDRHMVETLERLMAHHGPDAKAIVWEHNTHIGDARSTDMARDGMFNVGQLVRERHADAGVVLTGFGGYQGSVIAGAAWDAPMERMPVPPGREGSWEEILHRAGGEPKLLIFNDPEMPAAMRQERGHRAIGVVYDPNYERWGNYVPTVLPSRYDAFLFFDQTVALNPLHLRARDRGEPPETYPWNV
jgi:erythromycin esterase-like protein